MLVAKLKTELDKKEKQMEFLKQLAEEMHSRLEANPSPLVTSTPVPAPIPIPLPSPGLIESSPKEQIGPSLADLEEQYASLQKTFETQRKQLEATRNRVLTGIFLGASCNNFISYCFKQEKSYKDQLKEQTSLVDKLQNEKGYISRQMVSLRNRVTRMSGEKAAAQTTPDDVCRLLKRIKELEAQLAMFHTAEKPTDEPQVCRIYQTAKTSIIIQDSVIIR